MKIGEGSLVAHLEELEDPRTGPAILHKFMDILLIAYALVGSADCLVSGDKDLLVLDPLGGLRIIDPAAFLQVIEG